jgi:predicted nucleic acid-binding Zn ribbon protein
MRKCLNCKKPVKKPNKFCNSSCAAIFNNKQRVLTIEQRVKASMALSKSGETYEQTKERLLKKRKTCKNCYKTLARRQTVFCNSKCQKNFVELERIKRWKAFPETKPLDGGVRTIKNFIIYINGHQCSICKLFSWNGVPIPLVLDHIDGNSENNCKDNLRVVCGNCDMQLPTYKAKNKGNGRFSRRQRYKEGKSY